MGLLLLIAITAATVAIAHYSVVFLEPSKASWWKAGVLVITFGICNAVAKRMGLHLPLLLHWMLYIGGVAGVVWALYRLKPLHNITVAGCYVVGRFILVYSVSLLPLEKLSA